MTVVLPDARVTHKTSAKGSRVTGWTGVDIPCAVSERKCVREGKREFVGRKRTCCSVVNLVILYPKFLCIV